MINYILNAKSYYKKINIKCRSGFFNSFFFDKKIVFLSLFEWNKRILTKPFIPYITLIISNSEGPGEPNLINNDNQGNNVEIEENANDLANARNNQEAIRPAPANQPNNTQLNEKYS